MAVVPTGTFSGRFTSIGASTFLPLPNGSDWMFVQNETVSYAGGAGNVAQSWWFLGDAPGRGTKIVKEATIGALVPSQYGAGLGFTLQDTSVATPLAPVAITAVSNGTPPVVSTGNTAGLVAGSTIVSLYSVVGGQQLNGIDFTVGTVVANTSFTLAYMDPIAAAAAPGANAVYRIIPFDPYFYPRWRYITNIDLSGVAPAGITRVTLSVTHGFTIGQAVRLVVPTVTPTIFGTTQLNGNQYTIVNINQADSNGYTNTIDIAVDSSAMGAWQFPLTTSPGFTPAQVVPIGEDTAAALINPFNPALNGQNILADATINTAQRGMLLAGGAGSPGGANGNVITWISGKSFNQ